MCFQKEERLLGAIVIGQNLPNSDLIGGFLRQSMYVLQRDCCCQNSAKQVRCPILLTKPPEYTHTYLYPKFFPPICNHVHILRYYIREVVQKKEKEKQQEKGSEFDFIL